MNKAISSKRVVRITVILLASLSVYASDKFDGPLLGIIVGGDAGSANTKTSGSATTAPDVNISNSGTIAFNGVSGGVLAAYGKGLNGLYIGLEAAAEIHSAKRNFLNSVQVGGSLSAPISIQKKHTLSASFRLGKEISDELLIYIKGGVAYSTYRLASTVTIGGPATITAAAAQIKSLAQPLVGIGAERYICSVGQNINLIGGVEYTHVFARNASLNLSSSEFNGETNFKPSLDALKLRLVLRF